MPLKLEQLGQLVRNVAHDHRQDVDVLGVTRSEGDGPYAEVIVDLFSPGSESQRMSLGFRRDADVAVLREQIASKLDVGFSLVRPPG